MITSKPYRPRVEKPARAPERSLGAIMVDAVVKEVGEVVSNNTFGICVGFGLSAGVHGSAGGCVVESGGKAAVVGTYGYGLGSIGGSLGVSVLQSNAKNIDQSTGTSGTAGVSVGEVVVVSLEGSMDANGIYSRSLGVGIGATLTPVGVAPAPFEVSGGTSTTVRGWGQP